MNYFEKIYESLGELIIEGTTMIMQGQTELKEFIGNQHMVMFWSIAGLYIFVWWRTRKCGK